MVHVCPTRCMSKPCNITAVPENLGRRASCNLFFSFDHMTASLSQCRSYFKVRLFRLCYRCMSTYDFNPPPGSLGTPLSDPPPTRSDPPPAATWPAPPAPPALSAGTVFCPMSAKLSSVAAKESRENRTGWQVLVPAPRQPHGVHVLAHTFSRRHRP